MKAVPCPVIFLKLYPTSISLSDRYDLRVMRDLHWISQSFSACPMRSIMALIRCFPIFNVRHLTHCAVLNWGRNWGHKL